MSIRVMTKVWDEFPNGGPELLAMLALADWCDDEGYCWPSVATVAKRLRVSRSQAQRVLHALIERGLVSVVANAAGGAPGSTRRYKLELATFRGSTDATGRMDAKDGSHSCTKTGRMDATQTVIEPSRTVSDAVQRKKTVEALFERFWDAYPKKVGKQAACGQFAKVKADEALLQTMLRALAVQRKTEQWKRDSGRFIPNPMTWLEQGRWMDGDPYSSWPNGVGVHYI